MPIETIKNFQIILLHTSLSLKYRSMEKTISFLILIIIGVLFRSKVQNKEQKDTIKTLILAVALPAVIFSALLRINLNSSFIYPPLLVLSFNFILFALVRWMLPLLMGKNVSLANKRTLMLMMPSLAPYLSCFPFIAEFSNDTIIGLAAIADTGNKIFILIFLYFLAMYWAYGKQIFGKQELKTNKFINVLLQPINLSILIALAASLLGIRLETIPIYFQESLTYLRNLLTPTILIFIGLAVKVKRKELNLILGLLLWRAAIAFALSALAILLLNFDSRATILLVVAFPQSSCSFIPYAQMTIFNDRRVQNNPIFNPGLALSLLAISLPFSASTIIGIYSSGDFFASPLHLIGLSAVAFVTSCILLGNKTEELRTVSIAKQPAAKPIIEDRYLDRK